MREGGQTVRLRTGRHIACLLLAVLLPGCLAQKAELKQTKVDMDKVVSETRARLSQEIRVLRDEDFPALRGELDKIGHQSTTLRSRLDDLEHQTVSRLASLEKMQHEHVATLKRAQNEQVSSLKADLDQVREELGKVTARLEAMSTTVVSLAKSVDARLAEGDKAIGAGAAQTRALSEQMAQFGRALADFKQAMNGLGEKLIQQEEQSRELTAALSQRTEALAAKLEADAKATASHLADVNKSVGSVVKALETVSGTLVARIEQQDRRLDELAKAVNSKGTKPSKRAGQSHTDGPETKPAQPMDQLPRHEPAADNPQSAVPNPAGDSAGDSDKDAYEQALNAFKQGDLDGAMKGFSGFLVQHPASRLAPNAQYWLGECYYGKKEFEQAIEAFDRVKLDYPTSDKVPAALLKKGFAYLALKDQKRASSALRQVVDAYPKSPEAGKASDKLAQLKQIR
ncbi:MAG: tol-pal system protein YbgF [Nitrospirae bacterium]|nr:tol-pal system protein YbgF [Nitrospirota bacterium]